MKVAEAIELLQKQDPNDEIFISFISPDRQMKIQSNITHICKGAITDDYGNLVTGVLIMKEIPNEKK